MKQMFYPAKLILPMLFVTLTTMGCGGGPATFPTELVSGTVTLDGSPVEGANVTFRPTTDGQGNSAVGKTDASGVYHLTVVGNAGGMMPASGKGTTPGEYQIIVSKVIDNSVPTLSEEEAEEQGVEYVPQDDYVEADITYVVPVKYNSFTTSGLKASVKEGENNFPFALTSE